MSKKFMFHEQKEKKKKIKVVKMINRRSMVVLTLKKELIDYCFLAKE
jgi:hypothetical protein